MNKFELGMKKFLTENLELMFLIKNLEINISE